ncbi:putative immunity/bacteriocin fusion bifunctional protein [Lysinibacillus xylanilyticus]|uniref:putative immunity/bacteriocin fusion bifunctional protein n=1 Tax=Lysinibacillus xylanilyticus TaxID=582475 RepID=UPI003CFBDA6E
MKKFINILTVVCLALFSSVFISEDANAEINSGKECSTCQKEDAVQDAINFLEKQGTEVIQEVSKNSQEKAKFIVESDDTNQKGNSIISTYLNQGFKKAEAAQTFVEFKDLEDQGIIYEDIMNYTIHYYNEDQETVISENIWIDMKEEKILASTLTSLNLNNKDGEILDTFNVGKVEKDKSSNLVQARGTNFEFNGVSFACGMSGLIACASMCVGLHFIPGVGLVVGGTCDFLCGAAFAAGCSIS